jgi:hypothetical protein
LLSGFKTTNVFFSGTWVADLGNGMGEFAEGPHTGWEYSTTCSRNGRAPQPLPGLVGMPENLTGRLGTAAVEQRAPPGACRLECARP